uniref:Uncharacterized protein n=1 Tax=Nothobranchius furzeri TaxID=105023 RepID=A0A1A8UR50_NOTFU
MSHMSHVSSHGTSPGPYYEPVDIYAVNKRAQLSDGSSVSCDGQVRTQVGPTTCSSYIYEGLVFKDVLFFLLKDGLTNNSRSIKLCKLVNSNTFPLFMPFIRRWNTRHLYWTHLHCKETYFSF